MAKNWSKRKIMSKMLENLLTKYEFYMKLKEIENFVLKKNMKKILCSGWGGDQKYTRQNK